MGWAQGAPLVGAWLNTMVARAQGGPKGRPYTP
jgi:hypothetical protein